MLDRCHRGILFIGACALACQAKARAPIPDTISDADPIVTKYPLRGFTLRSGINGGIGASCGIDRGDGQARASAGPGVLQRGGKRMPKHARKMVGVQQAPIWRAVRGGRPSSRLDQSVHQRGQGEGRPSSSSEA